MPASMDIQFVTSLCAQFKLIDFLSSLVCLLTDGINVTSLPFKNPALRDVM